MSDMKTQPSDTDPRAFLAALDNPTRAEDAAKVMEIMARITGDPAVMWGESIIGFGQYAYHRADGSAHRFLRVGLSPRKANLSIYLMPGVKRYADLLADLGPHKHSVSCLYITRLSKVDTAVLERIIAASVADMDQMYPRDPAP